MLLSIDIAKILKNFVRIVVDLKKFEREGKLFKTLNGMGHSIAELTEYSEAFLDFAPIASGPVLDIGAAFGVASLPALERGAEVIINDMAQEHLDVIASKMPDHLKSRVFYRQGRVPDDLMFKPQSLGAIHSSQVFHFLSGEELMRMFDLMFTWLKPKGKIFVITGTPYVHILRKFIPIYEQRKSEGVRWPGELPSLKMYTSHPVSDDNPSFCHFLDDTILGRTAREAGFIVEKLSLFDRGDLPDHIKWDGRENVGLIAHKP